MTAQSDFLVVSVMRRRNNHFDRNAACAAFSPAGGDLPAVQRRDKAMTRYIEIVGWLIVSGLFVFAVGVLIGRW